MSIRVEIPKEIVDRLPFEAYKYLLLLEFHEKFESEVLRFRKKHNISPGMWYEVDGESKTTEKLRIKVAKMMSDLNIPLILFNSIWRFVTENDFCSATSEISVLGVDDKFFRKSLFAEDSMRKPTGYFDSKRGITYTDEKHTFWYKSNKDVVKSSYSTRFALPVITINVKVTRPQLIKLINNEWPKIESAMADYEKSVPFKSELHHISFKEIEDWVEIHRLRKERKMSDLKIAENMHKCFDYIRKIGSEMNKTLKIIGYVSDL